MEIKKIIDVKRLIGAKAAGDLISRIKKSEYFVVLGTESYFRSAHASAESYIAKEYNKPFIMLVSPGVTVPKWFVEGVEDIKKIELQEGVDIQQQIFNLINLNERETNFIDRYDDTKLVGIEYE